jgi:hypothetical protein
VNAILRWYRRKCDERKQIALRICSLHKRVAQRLHRLTAILSTVSLGMAWHLFAALHCLLLRRHTFAIGYIRRERDCEGNNNNELKVCHVSFSR